MSELNDPYWLFGAKPYYKTKIKEPKPLELSFEEQEILKNIDLSHLFDNYDNLVSFEYPGNTSESITRDFGENVNALEYIQNKLDTDQLVLYSGDLYGMEGFTAYGHSPGVSDTIWVDYDASKNPMGTLIHELAHVEKIGDENFKHNILGEPHEDVDIEWDKLEELIK